MSWNDPTPADRGDVVVNTSIETIEPPAVALKITRTFEATGYHVAMIYRGHLIKRVSAWTEGGRQAANDHAKEVALSLGVQDSVDEPMQIVVVESIIRYEREFHATRVDAYNKREVDFYLPRRSSRVHSHVVVWSSAAPLIGKELSSEIIERLIKDHL